VLLTRFLALLSLWRPIFQQERSLQRAVRQAVGALLVVGSATLTRILASLGLDQQDWSAEYKLHARAPWNEQNLFDALLPSALAYCPGSFVPIALDDTRLRKTGKRIPTAFWQRDPLSPPFRVNLQWGLRFLQASLLLPLHRKHNVNARAVPVRFVAAPSLKKPGSGGRGAGASAFSRATPAAQSQPAIGSFTNRIARKPGSGGRGAEASAGSRRRQLL
jgi:hypothetical protein